MYSSLIEYLGLDLRRQANASFYHVRTKFTGGYQQHQREVKKKELECPYHANKK